MSSTPTMNTLRRRALALCRRDESARGHLPGCNGLRPSFLQLEARESLEACGCVLVRPPASDGGALLSGWIMIEDAPARDRRFRPVAL